MNGFCFYSLATREQGHMVHFFSNFSGNILKIYIPAKQKTNNGVHVDSLVHQTKFLLQISASFRFPVYSQETLSASVSLL